MKDGHGGITVGSEISGGVRNLFAEICRLDSQNLDHALRVKNNAMRGGLLPAKGCSTGLTEPPRSASDKVMPLRTAAMMVSVLTLFDPIPSALTLAIVMAASKAMIEMTTSNSTMVKAAELTTAESALVPSRCVKCH